MTRFWENKKEESYRQTLDGHTRREKMYLSSTHLVQLQTEDANDEKDDFYFEDNENNRDSAMSTTSMIDDFVPNEDSKFVERHEPENVGRTKRWILSSGTDVGQILADYRCKIPESQKCLE